MKIAIIQYNAGNIQSVQFALKRLGHTAIVTDKHEALLSADKIIFPGVGNARAAMESLVEKQLDKLIPVLKQPLLGICVGMQLLCNFSEELDTDCLGIIDTSVKKFEHGIMGLKVPQIGWNNIGQYDSELLKDVPADAFVYYVHSYYVPICSATVAVTNYGLPYSAMLQQDNFYGVQFHTEKSAAIGDRILSNFLQFT